MKRFSQLICFFLATVDLGSDATFFCCWRSISQNNSVIPPLMRSGWPVLISTDTWLDHRWCSTTSNWSEIERMKRFTSKIKAPVITKYTHTYRPSHYNSYKEPLLKLCIPHFNYNNRKLHFNLTKHCLLTIYFTKAIIMFINNSFIIFETSLGLLNTYPFTLVHKTIQVIYSW